MRKWLSLFALAALALPLVVGHSVAQRDISDSAKLDIVNTVADLSTARVLDGGKVETLGYEAVGDGGGDVFYYDADSTATINGGFVMPGRGGSLAFDGYGNFTGTAGTGRFIAVDQSVANLRKFGSSGNATTDDDAVFRNAMNSGAPVVYGPAGLYNFNSTVNLKSNIRYCGDGIGATIFRRSGTQRSILSISTYDFENSDPDTFVSDKENIEICDMTLDWYFQSGWVPFAGLIQFKGNETGTTPRIENIWIHHVSFIDSQNVAHGGGGDAWAINVSSSAPDQSRLTIEDCQQLQEAHQFISGGGSGWATVRYRRNYVYHPDGNGITLTTVSEGAVFDDVQIVENNIIGPKGNGIWVGPDAVADGGNHQYSNVLIQDNRVHFDSYSTGGGTVGIRSNVSEGATQVVTIQNNQVTWGSTFPGTPIGIEVANQVGRTLTTNADYTQPAIDASVTISFAEDITTEMPVGCFVLIDDGGYYEVTAVDDVNDDLTVTLRGFYPSVAAASTVTTGKAATTRGTLKNINISGNHMPGGRLNLSGTELATVQGNDCDQINIDTYNRELSIINNALSRMTHTSHTSGVVKGNRFRQYDDSGSLGNIRINPGEIYSLSATDNLLYIGNVQTSRGETATQGTFVVEVAGTGIFAGRYYNNIASETTNRSFDLQNVETREGAWNVYKDGNIDGALASNRETHYYTESMDFDLTSVESQTINVTANGVSAGDFVLISVPNNTVNNNVIFTAKTKANQIRVTATRADGATAVDPASGTFQFMVIDPR